MSTTTIRLSDELKARLAEAAQAEGVTAHAFIVDAIRLRTAQSEARRDFVQEAQHRLAEMDRTGLAVPWDEARRYLVARAAGQKAARPRARKLKR
ncbi:MAG: ribbon-helix-helix protein, CopG family [Ideonella sp.]|nr:ribbon-helix-helix protein, CopG family [Ideonella sp.]MCC7459619.1 ribbon-helix-helix protein, CopG family [Nitrospira sp.]